MPSGFGANLLIRGVGRRATGKAAGDGNDARQSLKDRFHAPEAAAAYIRNFSFICVHGIGRLCCGFQAKYSGD
jgi:hypothetical protein